MLARLTPSSLSARLVATVVLLVALVSILLAGVTTFAMRSYLTGRLDGQVDDALTLAVGPDIPIEPDEDDDEPNVRTRLGQGPGTLTAYLYPNSRGGEIVTGTGHERPLSSSALDDLAEVPTDGHSHTVDLPGVGGYRVKAADTATATVVAGLPTAGVSDTVTSLVGWELLLFTGGVALAATAGWALVRRQLRPLRQVAATAHEVSELPLAAGEIALTVRVPDQLTDPRTEVGQVGAALNKMLGHVEHALDARHRSEQQVRQFVADASHELRTPLSTIAGYAELSRRNPEDLEQLALAMVKVESESARMSALVEDLLLLARLDAGRPLEHHEVDLTKLVLEAVDDARILGPDHRWVMELPDEPVTVVGDEKRLHQVVTNLLNNARLHTPADTTVTVSTRVQGDMVALRVDDDGPGVPDVLAASVFERFSRGDSSRTRASGGAGLGLSLVSAITLAHGGRVRVRSEPGDTSFEVCLPVGA